MLRPPCWIIALMCSMPWVVCRSRIPRPLYSIGSCTASLFILRTTFIRGSVEGSNAFMTLLHWFFVIVVAGRQYSSDFIIVVCTAIVVFVWFKCPLFRLVAHCLAFFSNCLHCSLQLPSPAIHTPSVSLASLIVSCRSFSFSLSLFLTFISSLYFVLLYSHLELFHLYRMYNQSLLLGSIAPPVVRNSSSQRMSCACAAMNNSSSEVMSPMFCIRSASSTNENPVMFIMSVVIGEINSIPYPSCLSASNRGVLTHAHIDGPAPLPCPIPCGILTHVVPP